MKKKEKEILVSLLKELMSLKDQKAEMADKQEDGRLKSYSFGVTDGLLVAVLKLDTAIKQLN